MTQAYRFGNAAHLCGVSEHHNALHLLNNVKEGGTEGSDSVDSGQAILLLETDRYRLLSGG